MFRNSLYIGILFIAVGIFAGGCQSDLVGPTANAEEEIAAGPSAITAKSDKAANPGPMIWANGKLFRSIVTTATFDGDQGNFDALYVLSPPHTFAGSYDHLSESAPGDQDYNGGRWEVFNLKAGVDPSKYDDVSSTDDPAFDPNDWESTHFYFECPLLP